MKFYIVLTATVSLLLVTGMAQAAQGIKNPLGPSPGTAQIAEHLFTPAVLEPNGFVAVCFATNLDSVARDLAAQIIDSTGAEVTQTTSCGTGLRSGVTCDSTAHFNNGSAL